MASFFYGPKIIYGIHQMHKASKALRRLSRQPMPTYRSAGSIQREAESLNPVGFTPQEKAAFNQRLNQRTNSALRQTTDRNPNFGQVVNAGINYGNVEAINQFAANDAQLRQNKIAQTRSLITAQSNAQTMENLRQRREKELAYGVAYQQGLNNVIGVMDSLDRDAASTTGMVTGGGYGNTLQGASTTPTPTPTYQPTYLGSRVPSMAAKNVAPSPFNYSQYGADLYGNPAGSDYTTQPPYYDYTIPYNITGPRE